MCVWKRQAKKEKPQNVAEISLLAEHLRAAGNKAHGSWSEAKTDKHAHLTETAETEFAGSFSLSPGPHTPFHGQTIATQSPNSSKRKRDCLTISMRF